MAGTIVLSHEQILEINSIRRDLGTAIDNTVKLMKCGEQCDQRKLELENLQARLAALIEHFAPPGS